ncbi:uncharacterized protein LOC119665854 [Teleopsis dalmanni]|uniref:uncharacterized protein LOC119665854 n=1 Tax=Teleopsis dalmanni TaxID=139649 RepID=UPI0018CE61E2|nr:uncharacterized protein LOC119665854 [Teleopsis dalmanni]
MFHHNIDEVTFWTDSSITLHWIKTHPSTLSTFVANRVSEIQEWSTSITWRHEQSQHNPTDIVSRGCNVTELVSSIWQTGPEYLSQDVTKWPIKIAPILTLEQESLETRKTRAVFIVSEEPSNAILNVVAAQSSYMKLMRIVAYILRFINRARKCQEEISLIPSVKQLNSAFLKVVEQIQKDAFQDEIYALMKKQLLKPGMQKLTPFLHNTNCGPNKVTLLRVGGRSLNAPISYDSKFPLLMPKNRHYINIYLRHLHLNICHAGPKALGSILLQKIWLVNAKAACSKTVRSCIHCFRYKPKLLTQIMGNLPIDQVTATRPFLISGVDFCGPMYTTLKIRGRPPVKTYIAIFVCFTSKAVHFEPVSDLTSNCFILCLKRFVGRRGLPERIYCDNATNFVGACRELKELQQMFKIQKDQLVSYAAQEGIEFVFIPPRAPHFGELWEAAVKSVKHLLLQTAGSAMLTNEELQTLVIQVEAVLNSRPIEALSQDPNDGQALTPAHLLIGDSLRTLPQESALDVQNSNLNYAQRWRLLCELKPKRSSRPSRRCPRRQSSPSPMVDRQGPRYGSRERRQGASGRR